MQSALQRNHEVTLFTRGQSKSGLFPNVEKLQGDRDGNLEALRSRNWDAVIDTSGFFPRVVRDSATLLRDNVNHYTFISSISVYRNLSQSGVREDSPVCQLEDPDYEDIEKDYGALKALCENEVKEAFLNRSLIIRPGLIVGPMDPTDRFTYWSTRVNQGGNVLAPGDPKAQLQYIDVRDLANWIIKMIEERETGVFNSTGPNYIVTMEEFLHGCNDVTEQKSRFTWVEDAFLLQHGVRPWIELPLWVPPIGDMEKYRHLFSADNTKALSKGLTFQSLEKTVRDILLWDRMRSKNEKRNAGLRREKELVLLREWDRAD